MTTESKSIIGLNKRRARRGHIDNISFSLRLPIMLLGSIPWITDVPRREARSITITPVLTALDGLPAAFEGTRIAFLTDLHCSRITPPDYIRRVVDETNRLEPDVILLGGDYVTHGDEYIRPLGQVLRHLRAPLGVYAVFGNHDYWDDPEVVREMLVSAGIVDVTNTGRWVHRGTSRIRIAGVGDLWEDEPDLGAALDGARDSDVAILLAHNPDYAVGLGDPRVKLVLSGHTHGGQICLPRIGPLITNSSYGRRVVSGSVDFGSFQLYTSRGIGTVIVPLRYLCPPEIALFTLKRK